MCKKLLNLKECHNFMLYLCIASVAVSLPPSSFTNLLQLITTLNKEIQSKLAFEWVSYAYPYMVGVDWPIPRSFLSSVGTLTYMYSAIDSVTKHLLSFKEPWSFITESLVASLLSLIPRPHTPLIVCSMNTEANWNLCRYWCKTSSSEKNMIHALCEKVWEQVW